MELLKEFWDEIKEMYQKSYKYIRFFSMIILLFCSSLFQIIPIMLFNIDTKTMSNDVGVGLTIFSTLISLLLSGLLYRKELISQFKKMKKMKRNKLFISLDNSIRYWLIGLVVMIISNCFLARIGIGDAENNNSVIRLFESSPFLASIHVILLTPLFEEMVFRMAFKDVLTKKWMFILVSGLVFGSIHVIGAAKDIVEFLYLIPYCSLGLAFAYIYQESDNVYISFFIHVLHNALTALYTFLLAGAIIW